MQSVHKDYSYLDSSNQYTRGHMMGAQDRTRNYKEGYLTYSTANLLPQLKIEGNYEPWNKLEDYLSILVNNGKRVIYY